MKNKKHHTHILTAALAGAAWLSTVASAQAIELTVTNGILFRLTSAKGVLNASGGAVTNNGDVAKWQDQSPNGHHFEPSYSTRSPSYQTNASPNGMQGIYFDGTMDNLRSYVPGEIRTLFIVFKPAQTITPEADFGTIFSASNGTETVEFGSRTSLYTDELVTLRSQNNATGASHLSLYTDAAGTISGATTLAVVFNAEEGAWDIFRDGDSVRNATSSLQTHSDNAGFVLSAANYTFLGARAAGGNDLFKGHLFEVIAYTNALGATDREAVEAYLDQQYVETERTITASVGPRGQISPSGAVATTLGASVEFQISAADGYHIEDILKDGVSLGGVQGLNATAYTYVWSPVTADGTLQVSIAPDATALTVVNDLALWLDATVGVMDDSGNPADSGDYIQTWIDQSPNARTFSPTSYGSTGRSPQLQGGVTANGKRGLRFDGANDLLEATNVTATYQTLVFAFAPTATITPATTPSQYLFGANGQYGESVELGAFTSTYANEVFGLRSLKSDGVGAVQAAYADEDGSLSGFTVVTLVHDAAAQGWRLYHNGCNVGSVSTKPDDNGFAIPDTRVYLGSHVDRGNFFSGHYFELLGYTAALSDADRRTVESYLKYKYTQFPLPTGTVITFR